MVVFDGHEYLTEEEKRLSQDRKREKYWKKWGPYVAERQWATVREDYSPDGDAWSHFSHEHSRSRAYRWGEDGISGVCDTHGFQNIAFAFWNEEDDFLKERLFGLSNPQGNHGEGVKEAHFHVDNTPHSYMKFLYKYPQKKFPYEDLLAENARRGKADNEYQIIDTGVFDEDRYWDIFIETAKESDDPDELLFRVTAWNRGPDPAPIHIVPHMWFRNTWAWGREPEDKKPSLGIHGENQVKSKHHSLGERFLSMSPSPGVGASGEDVLPKMIGLFGGNSNWRGPIWLCVNFLLVESLQRFFLFYGHEFQVECPTGSGDYMHLGHVSEEIQHRLQHLMTRNDDGRRSINDGNDLLDFDPHWRDYLWFYEFFDGDSGRGLGATHQCGWTGLMARMIHDTGTNCRLPHTPRTPSVGMAHYFDDVFTRNTGRRGSVHSIRGIRRSSTARSIDARSDFDNDINGDDSLGNSTHDLERERETAEADQHMHQYINSQLERFRDDKGGATDSQHDEYEATP
ncbi:hypothetical protein BN1723_005796 [Verticillium longisporum]|uniref:Mannosyl-oligosaccharide glucosidase n=1 Tax=Verticillium longisporum TaxID=100787 RepID=A0A0G4NBE7_VERLO|nr:hypothetical protein BN1723_005796 [Verticillium longisporum]